MEMIRVVFVMTQSSMKLDMTEKELRWLLLFVIAMVLAASGGLSFKNGSANWFGEVLWAMLK
jgi:hypothetical protein